MSDYVKNLNPAQRDAVINYDKPSLIVAGAGSGKTRVLTCRIAYMLEQGVAPHEILALTFTNKAAAEMRERIAALVGHARSRSLWMGTFHSIFARILRTEAAHIGFPQAFTIYDAADSRNVVKTVVRELSLNDETYKPAAVLSRISLAKNNLITPEAYESNTALVTEDRERKLPQLVEVYKKYAARCRENGAMDFDDLLLYINILFRDFPDVLAKYQQMFKYILVDEYQDTNYAQYIIVRRLAQHHSNVCVVGDDAQSIYSFRGAKIENILRFRNDFPGAATYKLEQNYRSTQTIVNAANSVIGKNRNRIKKESFSEGARGAAIKVLKAYTDQEEASMVADELRRAVREGDAAWNDAAILYRTNMQSRVMEEALRRRAIPYKIYGGMSFFQRKEVKDLIAYIRLVVNPRDDEAFRRIINFPSRGIGNVTIGRIAETAVRQGVSMWEAAATLPGEEIGTNAGTTKKIKEFTRMIGDLSQMRPTTDLYSLGLEIATRSGLITMFKLDTSPESMSALDNLQEVLNSMKTFSDDREREIAELEKAVAEEDGDAAEISMVEPPTLETWLQNVALLTDMDTEDPDEKNKVTLMTIHSAKGLEFRYVFVVGLEENLFPNLMGLGTPEGLEEERRLFYVALTRAKEAAVLSFSETRFKWGSMEFCRPSRFLSEIDPQYLDIAFPLDDTSAATETHPVAEFKKRYADRESDRRSAGGHPPRNETGRESGSGRAAASREPSGLPRGINRSDIVTGNRFRSMGSRVVADRDNPSDGVAARTGASADAQTVAGKPETVSGSGHTGSSTVTGTVSVGGFAPGMVVEHAKFGRGRVTAVERMGTDLKITVLFDEPRIGSKTLLSKFARLSVIG